MNKTIFLKTLFRFSLEFHALSHITSAESKNVTGFLIERFPNIIYIYIYIYNICYLPVGRSVLEKYFVEVLRTARGRRPRNVFETETKSFSSTDRPKR